MDSWILGAGVVLLIVLSGGAVLGALTFSAILFAFIFLGITAVQLYQRFAGDPPADGT